MKGLDLFLPKNLTFLLMPALVFLIFAKDLPADQQVHHELQADLQLSRQTLLIRDKMTMDWPPEGQLEVYIAPQARIFTVKVDDIDCEHSFSSGRITIFLPESRPTTSLSLSLQYEAGFDDSIPTDPVSFDNPGFGVTGTISDRGVFLLDGCGWYPQIQGLQSYFKLRVAAPKGFLAVTAGKLVGYEEKADQTISVWEIDQPVQGLSLSAGPYIVKSQDFDGKKIFTHFFSSTKELSGTYLDAAASHLRFYDSLHGAYPFPKFAVVENFFETGYGFPSYTLLGTMVLRLPFIPETSLRHEVAHSWWGNGVWVDYASGNWCEGLTTYVADYLSEELKSGSAGKAYRQQILRDYATLAAAGGDFPLREFVGRVSPASRAVGYGKAAFVYHMARQRLGDDSFWNSLRYVYKGKLFQKASWRDFEEVLVRQGNWNAKEARVFFDQWIERPGAPVLKLDDVSRVKSGSGWAVKGVLNQNAPFYQLNVPVTVTTSGGSVESIIKLSDARSSFVIEVGDRPQSLTIDPNANLFRLLYPEEIPPTVNSIKGSKKIAAVFSDAMPQELKQVFKLLLSSLNQEAVAILNEKEVEMQKINDIDFFFFGYPMRRDLQELFTQRPVGLDLANHQFAYGAAFSSKDADSLFVIFNRGGATGKFTALFLPIAGTDPGAIGAAVRKMTHYGKYSYLVFLNGANRAKGIWEVSQSPLIVHFKEES